MSLSFPSTIWPLLAVLALGALACTSDRSRLRIDTKGDFVDHDQESLCLTPWDWCPYDGSKSTGQVCGCQGDRGVVVTVDDEGYLTSNSAGQVCYTNFEPCLVEEALVGDECECGAIPGIVGNFLEP